MNRLRFSTLFLLFWMLAGGNLLASTVTVDGTSSIVYKNKNYVFGRAASASSTNATGFVRLEGGATILNNAAAVFDIFCPLSVGLDLRETGTIRLNGDLYLDSSVTITSSGTIQGGGHAVFLGGDLNLSTSTYVRVLHIGSNTIIDGCGHELILGNRAKLFVDDNVTLTLRNIILKPTFNYYTDPFLKLASHRSKLALENVIIDLVQDFNFMQGQLFIHDDVVFSGTSAFIYNSTQPSIITPGATLGFDNGTTFSITPATFTDCRFDIRPTYTSNNFIKMIDTTSTLYLNNCSLCTTLTGCRFTKGNVVFSNNVNLTSNTGSKISATPLTPEGFVSTGNYPRSVAWSPCGRYIAVANTTDGYIQVCRFFGSGNPVTISTLTTSSGPGSISWSPDGKFIVAGGVSGTFEVFSFSGQGSLVSIGTASVPGGSYSCKWSTDGKFIASFAGNDLRIFGFNPAGTQPLIGTVTTLNTPSTLAWSPNGKFIAVVGQADRLEMFSFSGSGNPVAIGSIATQSWPMSTSWSPDGRYLVVAHYGAYTIAIYAFNGGTPVFVTSIDIGMPTTAEDCFWSPDGKYIGILNINPHRLRILKFDSNQTLTDMGSISIGGSYGGSWSADGKFIAYGDGDTNSLHIVRVNYELDHSTQAIPNSIDFGDNSKGSSFDANIQVLAGAEVNIHGNVYIAQ